MPHVDLSRLPLYAYRTVIALVVLSSFGCTPEPESSKTVEPDVNTYQYCHHYAIAPTDKRSIIDDILVYDYVWVRLITSADGEEYVQFCDAKTGDIVRVIPMPEKIDLPPNAI